MNPRGCAPAGRPGNRRAAELGSLLVGRGGEQAGPPPAWDGAGADDAGPGGASRWRPWMAIAWPSFLCSATAFLCLFAFVDPATLAVFDRRIEASREALYTMAFFALWTITAASSAMTYALLPGPEALR
ncbi:hypothetical protein GCM10023144_36100 [Pigmentiphaga soli]|uniref:Uncharacterized protein n=1 Tax=Pigmentiphaga soli TaxID=1007095 RepID=A0ABP8HG52_9BURK